MSMTDERLAEIEAEATKCIEFWGGYQQTTRPIRMATANLDLLAEVRRLREREATEGQQAGQARPLPKAKNRGVRGARSDAPYLCRGSTRKENLYSNLTALYRNTRQPVDSY